MVGLLSTVDKKLTGVSTQVGAVYDNERQMMLSLNGLVACQARDQVSVQMPVVENDEIVNIIQPEDILSVSNSQVSLQDIVSATRYPKLSKVIRDYLKNFHLKSDDPSLIKDNEEKPTWDVSVGLADDVNQNLANALIIYAREQPESTSVTGKELGTIIINNYYNRLADSKLVPELREAKKTANRRGNRKTELFKRRKRTFVKHKEAVERRFNRDASGVFHRDVMSDDETDMEITVRVLRPNWRSDELNELFDFLDMLAKKDLGKKASQLKTRHYVVIQKTIPRGLVAKIPAWSKRE
ncbi:hypothetical protein CLU79DRAFT_753730 [Phycomyces nitens]|nr:hypothetical protein CLU79DRAFT_753730 [Phycomyces nitens]